MADLLAAHRHTTNNRADVESSSLCGCCCCMQTFSPDEVVAWSGLDFSNFDDPDAANGETALCPRCGGESVIGNKSGFDINAAFLLQMNEAWFQKTIIRKPSAKK